MGTDDKAETADTASPGDTPAALSNFARLAQHLKTGSLAAKLVTAWEAGAQGTPQQNLLAAVRAHHAPKEKADGEGAA